MRLPVCTAEMSKENEQVLLGLKPSFALFWHRGPGQVISPSAPRFPLWPKGTVILILQAVSISSKTFEVPASQ